MSVFSAYARIEGSTFSCIAIDMNAEAIGPEPALEDAGGNRCGCDALEACRVSSADLEPPPVFEAD